jgi:GDPmannose 4,6-dehydratase
MKTALISGITGQDGAYLARLLLEKGYRVIGLSRQPNALSDYRFAFLGIQDKLEIERVDLCDGAQINAILKKYKPHEIYHLAAQSSVGQSFKDPADTFKFNSLSVLTFLEEILKVDPEIRFYQASSSEMFGDVKFKNLPIKESLLFHPVSPYGISKAAAHWLTVNYREAFGLFASCGILFNHESALRGDNFVIKKLIHSAIQIKRGNAQTVTLGNLAVSRDWGYAPKYVEAMWLILQQETTSDYVICSGNLVTLQEIVLMVFEQLGLDLKTHLRLDQNFLRTRDLGITYGDSSKARKTLNWNYNLTTENLVAQLISDEWDLINWKESLS